MMLKQTYPDNRWSGHLHSFLLQIIIRTSHSNATPGMIGSKADNKRTTPDRFTSSKNTRILLRLIQYKSKPRRLDHKRMIQTSQLDICLTD